MVKNGGWISVCVASSRFLLTQMDCYHFDPSYICLSCGHDECVFEVLLDFTELNSLFDFFDFHPSNSVVENPSFAAITELCGGTGPRQKREKNFGRS